MSKLLREHPLLIVTLFWAYMAWISLTWETVYLRQFGITAIDYGTFEDILKLSFRRPENIFMVLFYFVVIYFVPFSSSYLRGKEKEKYIFRDVVRLVVLVFFLLWQGYAAKMDAEYRANEIKKISAETVLKTNLNLLVVANITMKKSTEPMLNQVIVTRLGGSTFVYSPETGLVSILSTSEIERMEVVSNKKA